MNLQEIKIKCRNGNTAIIPGWKGYLKWNYAVDELLFVNNDYIMRQTELENALKNRTDLYYII